MEKPYVPFYRPYGMSEEEYNHEVQIAEQKLAEWQQMQNDMNTQQHTTPLYALTKITDTDGLPEGRYIVKNDYGMFEVSFDNKYQFNEEFTDCSDLTHYLRPLPPGTQTIEPGMVEKMLSYESLQPLVERIAYEQMSADQLGDLVAKMDLIKQFIQTKLAQQGE